MKATRLAFWCNKVEFAISAGVKEPIIKDIIDETEHDQKTVQRWSEYQFISAVRKDTTKQSSHLVKYIKPR